MVLDAPSLEIKPYLVRRTFVLKKFLISLQDYVQCFAMKVCVLFFSNIPKFIAYRMAELLGIFIFLFAFGKRRQIYENLKIVYPNGTPFNKRIFACKVFIHFSYFFLELFFAKRLINKDNVRDYVIGPAIDFAIEERKRTNRGIFVTGHLGAGTVIGQVMTQFGYKTTVVVRSMGPKKFNKIITGLFGDDQKVVMKKQAYSEFKKILETPGSAYPSIYMDQHAGRKSLYLDFMGKKAYTAAGAASLARAYNVPIYAIALIRIGKPKYKLKLERIDPIITEDKQADIEKLTRKCNQYLEQWIRETPEQWFWMHRRWR